MKKKKRGIRRASAVIAFILLTSIAFLSAVFTLEMIDSQIYRNSQEETEADYREQIGSYLAAEIFSEFVNSDIRMQGLLYTVWLMRRTLIFMYLKRV